MSRKDYKLMAKEIKRQLEIGGNASQYRIMLRSVADTFADVAKKDNERFDRSRFIDACGFNHN